MTSLSDDEGSIKRLLNDRVEFKLYAAEQHLNRLIEIENAYGDIAKYNARIEVEMEVDCFLSQLVGAVDSLLFQINDRLDLGVSPNHVNFANVQSALSAKTKKIDLLSPLDKARQHGNWYFMLSELRNQLVHKTFLRNVIPIQDVQPKPRQLRFLNVLREFAGNDPSEAVMDMEVTRYLEKGLQQVRELIFSIRASEPLLQEQP
ncbi:MAG TPA: hypothetical protein VFQ47_04650 [Nitrososphaera sp.]|jgi:hypothetical protein|nr:hypothetical protein [Nitrososphaera sp.]